ncbi:hypothetical protein GF420_00680 [candidate division GN15 bacterium]|nr:hypothetical protein [candidate division GN15 bacterium]
MHEFDLARSILDIVNQEASSRGLQPMAVEITVGRMSDVVPEALSFALDTQAAERGLVGVTFNMCPVPVTMLCRRCGHEYEVADSDFTCSGCRSTDVEMISGDELEVATIEFEDRPCETSQETPYEDTV